MRATTTSQIVAMCLIAILVAGCADALAPTPSPTPIATTVPTAEPPAPTLTPVMTAGPQPSTPIDPDVPGEDSLPTSATVERDGVRLTIRLGTSPVYAGNQAVVFTTIENTEDSVLRWINDGCDENAYVRGVVDGAWRESGRSVSAELAPYREWFREEAGVEEPITVVVRSGFGIGNPSSGCADLGLGRELAPGESVTQEAYWDGQASPRLGLPPTNPLTLTATFDLWYRGENDEATGDPIVVTLDSWVVGGRRSDYLSPAEAIDAALADRRLASWLVTRPLRSGARAMAEYHQDAGVWIVGLLMYRDLEYGDPGEGILHAAFVDAITGEVVAVREHPAQI